MSASQRHRIRWRLLAEEDVPELCGEERAPGGKVTCEVPKRDHKMQHHAGRGPSGRWFIWGPRQS